MTWKTIGSISLCLIRLEEKEKVLIKAEEERQGWEINLIYRWFPALFTRCYMQASPSVSSSLGWSSTTMTPICWQGNWERGETGRWSEKRWERNRKNRWNLTMCEDKARLDESMEQRAEKVFWIKKGTLKKTILFIINKQLLEFYMCLYTQHQLKNRPTVTH